MYTACSVLLPNHAVCGCSFHCGSEGSGIMVSWTHFRAEKNNDFSRATNTFVTDQCLHVRPSVRSAPPQLSYMRHVCAQAPLFLLAHLFLLCACPQLRAF